MTSPAQWQASGGGQAATQTRGGTGRAGDVREGAAAAEAEPEALREIPEPSDEGAQQDAAGAAGLLRVDDATPSVAPSPRAAEGVASAGEEGGGGDRAGDVPGVAARAEKERPYAAPAGAARGTGSSGGGDRGTGWNAHVVQRRPRRQRRRRRRQRRQWRLWRGQQRCSGNRERHR